MQNDFGAIQLLTFQYCDCNIGLFSIAPNKVIALNSFATFIFISSLLLSLLLSLYSNYSSNYCNFGKINHIRIRQEEK